MFGLTELFLGLPTFNYDLGEISGKGFPRFSHFLLCKTRVEGTRTRVMCRRDFKVNGNSMLQMGLWEN